MKQFFGSLLGATSLGALAYLWIDQILHWYGERYIASDADITTAYLWASVALVFALFAGGVAGWQLTRPNKNSPRP